MSAGIESKYDVLSDAEVIVTQAWRVSETQIPPESPKKPQFRAFDPQRDINRISNTRTPEELQLELTMVGINWRTFLAELYGVAVFKAEYNISPTDLTDSVTNKSLFGIIEGGIAGAKEAGLSQEDVARNEAELGAFTKAHNTVNSGLVAEGGVFIHPTLQGSERSIFQGNYVDLLLKYGNKLYLRRYATELDAPQMAQAINGLTEAYHYPVDAEPLDLKRKAVYVGEQTLGKLKEALQLGKARITDQRFTEVLDVVLPLIEQYKEALQEKPIQKAWLEALYTAIITLADDVVAGRAVKYKDYEANYRESSIGNGYYDNRYPAIDIDYYRNQKISFRLIPCGQVGEQQEGREGFGFTDVRLAGAVDLGNLLGIQSGWTSEQAKKDPNLCRCEQASGPHFHCPGKKEGKKCKHPIVVGEGFTKCPSCGLGKTC